MRMSDTPLPGLILIEPDLYRDPRGVFWEAFHEERYKSAGMHGPFVQDNFSWSIRHTLRGLHYQLHRPQGKLVTVVQGAVYDVAVDIRRGSPNFGRWVGYELSADNFRQLFVPAGFAHGFCVVQGPVQVEYKCTDFYDQSDEITLAWDDPAIGIEWPIREPQLSAKDAAGETLAALGDRLPTFGAGR